ncbi:MAG: sigma-54 dependent transcriptional regulator [Muribaculaceae bacterium]|nr:sigma-54 dependent transcriptional regulator [Muribaculaceae bacterium]
MILIVDDDSIVRSSLSLLLKRDGYVCTCAASPDEAMQTVRAAVPEAVLLDMNFGMSTTGDDGLTLLRQIKLFLPEVPVILITAWGSIDLAVRGMRAGAFDFITKPWDNAHVLESIANALKVNVRTEDDATGSFDRGNIIGRDGALSEVLDIVKRVAPTSAPVLITGESGTGKELIAEAIHRNSKRRDAPFIKVNLGGIPAALFESEMFGYKKGAFTGAVSDRVGRFEAANGGTIFLDEIGELDIACQVKLLRVLQEHTFEPLGSNRPRKVDVRVVCATNADLRRLVAEKRFREDLYYRICVVNVDLPPLRERGHDIRLLAEHFLAESCRANDLPVPRLGDSAIRFLMSHNYPGNIRELKNMMERTALIATGQELSEADVRGMINSAVMAPDTPLRSLDEIEEARIREVLDKHRGNVSRAARELGISRGALYRRIEKFGIDI